MINRELVKTARLKNPCATLQQIGNDIGITRERVRQILSEEGLNTSAWKQTYYCLNCDKEIATGRKFCSKRCDSDYTRIQIECPVCGKCHNPYVMECDCHRGTFAPSPTDQPWGTDDDAARPVGPPNTIITWC